MISIPRVALGAPTTELANQAGFIRQVFEGADTAALIQTQLDRLHADLTDAAAYLTLSLLYQLIGQKAEALTCQEIALSYSRLYRQAPASGQDASLTLLAIMAPGDLMTNTPIELLLDGRPVEIIRLYIDAGQPIPEILPEHDLALVAISESDETRTLLQRLTDLAARWPRPVVNDAAAILDLARDRLYAKLDGVAGACIPPTLRVPRFAVAEVAAGLKPVDQVLPGGAFPLIVRPVGSHAGKGLERVQTPSALADYLTQTSAGGFFLSRFIDYASADGHFRKYRVAMFGGRAHLAHMAVGDHWMVHYLNAGMAESAAKRAEEAQAMAGFETGFGGRHAQALAEITRRLGLDYYALDCAETPEGDLLIFEADVGMILHALDPQDLYPYKRPRMQALFTAFEGMLRDKVGQRADA